MELMAWTDERLAERFDRIDERFDRTDERFDDVNRQFNEVNRQFDEVNRQFDEVNRRITEASAAANYRIDGVKDEVAEVRQSMWALQRALNRGSFGVIVCLIGVIGAILAKGG